jgi:uncharacterized protein
MLDPETLVLIALTFLLAGSVKGVIGLGLPTVSLALLTVTVGLQPAIALLLVPAFATNVWQALVGGNGRVLLARLWPFLLAASATVWFGASALTRVDVALLSALLGILLAFYAIVSLSRVHISIPRRWEPWVGPMAGALNGLFGGMTGSFAVPGILYLQSIDLPRDRLIQAMGMLFTASSIALAISLGGHRLLTVELVSVSSAAVLPAAIGMSLGRRYRDRLSERTFRRVFLLALLGMGIVIFIQSMT